MWLLIDDFRNSNVDVIARTASAAKKLLPLKCWDTICLDHDLGEGDSGYDILKWAIKTNNLNKANIKLVSSNPVGRDNMGNLLKDSGYTTKDNFTYVFNS